METRRSRHTLNAMAAMALLINGVFNPAYAQVSAIAPRASTVRVTTLDQVLQSGKIKMQLVGDGVNTTKCQLILINALTGATSTTTLPTLCISKKNQSPPPPLQKAQALQISYRPAGTANGATVAVTQAAAQLATAGQYAHLPIRPETAAQTIAQLAIWKQNGAGDPEARVTAENIKSDVLKMAHLTEKEMSPVARRSFNHTAQEIFASIDLTCKLGEQIAQEQPRTQNPRQPMLAFLPGGAQPTNSCGESPIVPCTTDTPANSCGESPIVPCTTDTPANSCGESPIVPCTSATDTHGTNSSPLQQSGTAALSQPGVLVPVNTVFEAYNKPYESTVTADTVSPASPSKYQDMMVTQDTFVPLPIDDRQQPVVAQNPNALASSDTIATLPSDNDKASPGDDSDSYTHDRQCEEPNYCGNGPQMAKKQPKPMVCKWVFRDYKKVDFGKATEAQQKLKDKLQEFVAKAVEYGEQATAVLDAIKDIGPQSGKCDVEIIYDCVVIEPGDSGVPMYTVLKSDVVTLSPGTDADATDFQHNADARLAGLVNKPRTKFSQDDVNFYSEQMALFDRHRPRKPCCGGGAI